jgi:hypothetical protein
MKQLINQIINQIKSLLGNKSSENTQVTKASNDSIAVKDGVDTPPDKIVDTTSQGNYAKKAQDSGNSNENGCNVSVETPAQNNVVKEDWKTVYVKYKLEIGITADDGITIDQLFEKIAKRIKELNVDTPQAPPVKSEEDFIKELLVEMKKKGTISDAFTDNNTPISTQEQLIAALDKLLMPESKPEISAEELRAVCASPNTEQINELKKYVKSWLETHLSFKVAPNVLADNAVKGHELLTEDDIKKRALTLVEDKIGTSFNNLDDFKSAWDARGQISPVSLDNKLLDRLKEITGSKANTVDEIIAELKNSTSIVVSPENKDDVKVAGRTFGEAESDLKAYDRLKSLAEFGETAEDVKRAVIKQATEGILNNALVDMPKDEDLDCNDELKKLVDKIKKSSTIEQMVNAFKQLLIVAVKDAQANATVIACLKEKYQELFNEEMKLNDSNPLNAVNVLSQQVAEKIDRLRNIISENENKLRNNDDELKEKNQALTSVCNQYMLIISNTFNQVRQFVSGACNDVYNESPLPSRFIQLVQDNDGFPLETFKVQLQEILSEDTEFEKKKTKLHDLFMQALSANSWIHGLTRMYLYVQLPEIAAQFEGDGLDVRDIKTAFVLTEHLLNVVDIKLSYPNLFIDQFNDTLYEVESLADVRDYVNNVNELVGNRHDIIIDLHRVGYASQGQVQKPIVSIFN